MKNYEVTFIVDPVLSADEIKSTAQTYQDMLKNEGCEIIAINELGLKGLAYEIKKRSSGIYYVIEFSNKDGEIINKLELALRRDQRIMRFLTVHLDKYGVKYNEDKRAGKIGSVKDRVKKEEKPTDVRDLRYTKTEAAPKPAPAAPATPAPAAPATAAPAAETATTSEPVSVPEAVTTPEAVSTPEAIITPEPIPAPVTETEAVSAPELDTPSESEVVEPTVVAESESEPAIKNDEE